jgi:alanine racemase
MTDTAPSRVIVELSAYAKNLAAVQRLVHGKATVMAIVKANAYGHGLLPIAKRAIAEGVAMLGVANMEEAIALRENGITAPVLVMVQPPVEQFLLAIERNIRLLISDLRAAEHLGEIAHKAGKVVPIHVKVDTGMGRQGFDVSHAYEDILFITRISNIDIEGVATHFPVSDLADDPFTKDQIKAFKRLLKDLDKQGVPYEMAHAANSAAILNYAEDLFTMVRPGLMTYGIWPTASAPQKGLLKPVLRWESRIVLVKEFQAGTSIGYGRTYTTQEDMRGAIVPVGYADGYRHALANRAEVLVRGRRCPVRGAVSMDQLVVDISKVQGVAAGEVVTLIGKDGKEEVTVEELARHAGTIPYDILTGIGPRVRREYVE